MLCTTSATKLLPWGAKPGRDGPRNVRTSPLAHQTAGASPQKQGAPAFDGRQRPQTKLHGKRLVVVVPNHTNLQPLALPRDASDLRGPHWLAAKLLRIQNPMPSANFSAASHLSPGLASSCSAASALEALAALAALAASSPSAEGRKRQSSIRRPEWLESAQNFTRSGQAENSVCAD